MGGYFTRRQIVGAVLGGVALTLIVWAAAVLVLSGGQP